MNIFLLYILKVNIILTVLYLFYVLFCTRDTFFSLRRTVLLMCYAIAFIAPVIHLPADSFLFRQENPVNLGVIYEKIWTDTSEVLIQDTLVTVTQTTIPALVKFLFVIYLIGALVMLLRTGMELRHTFLLIIQSKKQCIQGVTVWIHPDNRSPFSFFRWICIGKELTERQELSEVLIHEQTHVRCLHSIDMVLAQMVIVCCWFNPVAWLLRREIRINHEYEADDTVMKAGFNKKKLSVSPDRNGIYSYGCSKYI